MSISSWISALNTSLGSNDPVATAALFVKDGFWRDFLALGWTLQTLEGRAQIEEFAAQTAKRAEFQAVSLADDDATEGFFSFQSKQGRGRGYVRLVGDKCLTLLTVLEELKGNDLPLRQPLRFDRGRRAGRSGAGGAVGNAGRALSDHRQAPQGRGPMALAVQSADAA